MELVILGTSNCIVPDSFVAEICRRSQIEVRNFSLGACTSNLGLYASTMIDPTERGVALIDYALNDGYAAHIWGEARWRPFASRNIRTAGSRLRSKNYLPIVLVLPHDLHVDHQMSGERTHEAVCIAEKINFINLRKVFFAALRKGGTSEALMRDGAHMSGRAAQIVGTFMSDILERIAATVPSTANFATRVASHRVVLAQELFSPSRLVEHKSSLRSARYGRLLIGEVLHLPVNCGESVGAVMINTGAMGGTVVLRGKEGQVVKSLTIYWFEDRPELFSSILVDILGLVTGSPKGATIEIATPDSIVTEATLEGKRSLPGRYGEIEIEGVLLTQSAEHIDTVSAPTYDWLPLDLGSLPEVGRLVDALARLRPMSTDDGMLASTKGAIGTARRFVANRVFRWLPRRQR
jgi:hypothetical protein